MVELRLRNRHRLKQKAASVVADAVGALLGEVIAGEGMEVAEANGQEVYLKDGRVVAFGVRGRLFPSLHALLRSPPSRRGIVVDMGAIPHLTNGADLMAPGVVEADPSLARGDIAWVADERNRRPVAVVECLMGGEEMVRERSGKAAKMVHYVGDWMWSLEA